MIKKEKTALMISILPETHKENIKTGVKKYENGILM